MFCPNCGAEAADADRFCRNCGRELPATASASDTPAAPETGRREPGPGPTWSGQPRPTPGPVSPVGARAWPNAPAVPGIAGQPIIASGGQRIGAFALDVVFAIVLFVGLAILAGFIIGFVLAIRDSGATPELTPEEEGQVVSVVSAIWAIATFVGTWVLNTTGGSVGKRIVGLRIVREDLQAPGWGVGLGRTAAAWLSWPVVGLGFLWGLWDERGQTWHDKMAGTYVVRADSLPRPHPPGVAPPGSLH
jgi:uncharacterized RDD family membrane protein YckC